MTEPDFKLNDSEIHSALWMRLSEHLQERLDAHRKDNDGNLTYEQTIKLRGRIAEILVILGTAERDIPDKVADYDE